MLINPTDFLIHKLKRDNQFLRYIMNLLLEWNQSITIIHYEPINRNIFIQYYIINQLKSFNRFNQM